MEIGDIEEKILKFCAIVGLTVVLIVYGGFTLSYLWGIYIVTVFEIFPLTVTQAIGINLFVNFLLRSAKTINKNTDYYVLMKIHFVMYTVFLIFGFIFEWLVL